MRYRNKKSLVGFTLMGSAVGMALAPFITLYTIVAGTPIVMSIASFVLTFGIMALGGAWFGIASIALQEASDMADDHIL